MIDKPGEPSALLRGRTKLHREPRLATARTSEQAPRGNTRAIIQTGLEIAQLASSTDEFYGAINRIEQVEIFFRFTGQPMPRPQCEMRLVNIDRYSIAMRLNEDVVAAADPPALSACGWGPLRQLRTLISMPVPTA